MTNASNTEKANDTISNGIRYRIGLLRNTTHRPVKATRNIRSRRLKITRALTIPRKIKSFLVTGFAAPGAFEIKQPVQQEDDQEGGNSSLQTLFVRLGSKQSG